MTHRATGATVTFRPATDDDRAMLRALVDGATAGTPYTEIPTYFLRRALDGRDSECRATVAERDGELVGCVLFGDVAGAVGIGRIHLVTVAPSARGRGIARGLCDAAVADLPAPATRSIVVEMPDDEAVGAGRALIARCGFTEVARVPDYYRDGVALLVLQRTTAATR